MLSYAPWVSTFEADRPLIPTKQITEALDHVEGEASGAIAIDLIKGADLLSRPGRDIQDLTWGIGVQMQRHLTQLWQSGYQLGGRHGWREMVAAVPEEVRSTYDLDPQVLSAIAALLADDQSFPTIPLNLEQAIANRVLAIAGTYSKDILSKIKGHLTAAALGQDINLKEEISKTLKVGRVRAETIARNELTYAYNTARVQVFKQSSLVSHVRFISILDGRTSEICRTRNGMIIPMADMGAIESNRPPLHHRCRSLLSPVMPLINPDHQAWVDDPKRAWDGRELEPLAEGWNGTTQQTATFAKTAKKGKGKGKKNCNRGLNCGGTCISAKKKCKKDNPSPVVKVKAKKPRGVGGGGAETPSLKDAIAAELKKTDAKLSALKAENEAALKAWDGTEEGLGPMRDRAKKIFALQQLSEQRVKKIVSDHAAKHGVEVDGLAHGMATPERHTAINIGNMYVRDPDGFAIDSNATAFVAATLGRRPPYPDSLLQYTNEIYFSKQANKDDTYWQKAYNNPNHVSAATGGDGRIVVYNGGKLNAGDFSHEAGHNLAKGIYGDTNPPPNSDYGKRSQGLKEVSAYAKNSIGESFAEDISAYFEAPARMQQLHPERYKLIDDIVKGVKVTRYRRRAIA